MSEGRPVYEAGPDGVLMRAGYRPPHLFSDGDTAEAYVREAVLGAADLSDGSEELAALIRDWPSEYHFSPARSTLLAPFDFDGLTVLEVGAGCGAITRALGEAGARVTALEASPARAGIAAARCRDLEAVQVVCDDFAAFVPGEPADAVLLIGVLEYAPLFFRGPDPVGAALAQARACLAPGGAIVVAIENQLGLKYFAGCTEDHTGVPFYGIEDRYRDDAGPVTFGRAELSRRLAEAGLGHQRFTYPLPDYKLPRLLLTEEALEDPRLDDGHLAGWAGSRDYLQPHVPLFSEAAAWEAIGRNGLVADFSNSFLVAAAPEPGGRLLAAPNWLAELRAGGRARAFRTTTRVLAAGDDLLVRKTALEPDAEPPASSPVAVSLPLEGPYLPGRPLAATARELAESDAATLEALADVLRPWTRALGADGPGEPDARELPPAALDLMPWNLMLPDGADGEPRPFDQEWVATRRFTVAHAVFRGLFHLLGGVQTARPLTGDGTVAGAIAALAGLLGAPLDHQLLRLLTRREAEIQSVVYETPFDLALESLERALERPTQEPVPAPLGDGGAAAAALVIEESARTLAEAAADLERRRSLLQDSLAASAEEDDDPTGFTLQRLRRGSARKLHAFRHAARRDGVAPAVASTGRSLRNSMLYWTGHAPPPAVEGLDVTALAGPPSPWRALPPSVRRIGVAVALAGATAQDATATLDGLLHQSHLLYDVAICTDGCAADVTSIALKTTLEDPRFSVLAPRPAGDPARPGPEARVAALARAVDASSGDYVLLVLGGDVLHGQSLAEIAHAADIEPRCTLVYADTGTPDRRDPASPGGWLPGANFRKPDWSPDYLLATPYAAGCVAVRRDLYAALGGLDPALGAAAEYDLLLRAAEAGARVRHVARVLVRRPGPLPPGAPSPDDAAAKEKVLSAAASRLVPPAMVRPGLVPGLWRLARHDNQRPPVTLVVITSDPVCEIEGRGDLRVLANFLRSISEKTSYPDHRLLVVDDGVLSDESAGLLEAAGGRRITYDGNGSDARGFNFSRKVNFALANVETEHFVLLNDDLEVISPDWLEALMDYAVMPEVGAVGAHLLFADGRTQHAGVVAWPGGPGHAFYAQSPGRVSPGGSPLVVRDFAAVTAAVIASDLTTLRTVGPLDERLAHDFQDVDFCLRMDRLGYRLVYTPHCRMYHFENATLSRSAPAPQDHALFMSRWADWHARDPYYLKS